MSLSPAQDRWSDKGHEPQFMDLSKVSDLVPLGGSEALIKSIGAYATRTKVSYENIAVTDRPSDIEVGLRWPWIFESLRRLEAAVIEELENCNSINTKLFRLMAVWDLLGGPENLRDEDYVNTAVKLLLDPANVLITETAGVLILAPIFQRNEGYPSSRQVVMATLMGLLQAEVAVGTRSALMNRLTLVLLRVVEGLGGLITFSVELDKANSWLYAPYRTRTMSDAKIMATLKKGCDMREAQ